MARVNRFQIKRKNLPQVPEAHRSVITPALISQVIRCKNVDKMNNALISRRLDLAYNTVRNIIKKYEKDYDPVIGVAFDPKTVLSRRKQDPMERIELLQDDSIATLELTMAVIRHRLEREVALTTPDGKQNDVSTRELMQFFNNAAPYVLAKVDTKKEKDGKEILRPIADIYQEFKNHEEKKKAGRPKKQ